MRVDLRLIAHGLLVVSAFMFVPLQGCSEEDNPSHYRLGPFYGYDSLRYYEYSNSGYTGTPQETIPDSARHAVTVVGYLVEVLVPGPDTIKLRIGTRFLYQSISSAPPDSFYDTLYANSAYLREGDRFRFLDSIQPFPFLDPAYVTDKDTVRTTSSGSGYAVLNLAAALQGAPAVCTRIGYSGYAGGGGSFSSGAVYTQGIGMTSCSQQRGRNPGLFISLVSAKGPKR